MPLESPPNRAAVQSTPHILVSDTRIPSIAFSGEYTGIFLEVLVKCVIYRCLCNQLAGTAAFNIGGI